ncbi:MAG: hypothetical protein PUA55_00250 [Mycoplasma sp.]|nr:hypothetical protein [Mycoplasma sp.]
MNVYLKSKNNENKILVKYILILIPFLIYGFYKNGILLYKGEYVNIFYMFKPLILTIISILISYLFAKYKKEDFISYRLYLNILSSLIALPNTNIFIYLIILFLVNILYTFKKVNISLITILSLIIVSMIFSKYSFLNIYEESVNHSYSITNYLFGNGSGGISNTLFIYSILVFIYLICDFSYKKHIVVTSLTVYYILLIISFVLFKKFDYNLLLNNNLVFSFIFLNTISIFTPYTKGGCYLYGFILGLISFCFSFIDINLGVYLISLILSFTSLYFDKLILKISSK